MIVTEKGLCKVPSWMFPRRQFDITCGYKFVDLPNELLHKTLIHAVIAKGM